MNLRKGILISIFSSISLIFMLVFEIPIFPAFSWLKYDPSDIPLLLVGFKMGPLAALSALLLKTLLFYFIKGDGWGMIGLSFSLISGFMFIVIPTWIYFIRKSLRRAVFALISGTILMTVIMAPLNYYVASKVMNMSGEALFKYITLGVVPFNLLKGIINTIIIMLLYKRLWRILKEDED